MCFIASACCFYGFIVNAQPLPSKKEQFDFLQWYLKEKKFKGLKDSTVAFSIGSDNMKSINEIVSQNHKFSKSTRAFLKRQIIATRIKSPLDTANLKGVDWKKKEDSTIYESYISLPVFSKSKRTVFISWGYYCGNECGKESIDIFVRTNNNGWKESRKYIVPVVVF